MPLIPTSVQKSTTFAKWIFWGKTVTFTLGGNKVNRLLLKRVMLIFSEVLREVKRGSERLVRQDHLWHPEHSVWPEHLCWSYNLVRLESMEQWENMLWAYNLAAIMLISIGYSKPKNEKWQKNGPTSKRPFPPTTALNLDFYSLY